MKKKMLIKIKYFNKKMSKLEINPKGDLIDVRVRSVEYLPLTPSDKDKSHIMLDVYTDYEYKQGDVLLLRLGVAIELPKGYRMNLFPRSSTFKKYGFLLTNSVGM